MKIKDITELANTEVRVSPHAKSVLTRAELKLAIKKHADTVTEQLKSGYKPEVREYDGEEFHEACVTQFDAAEGSVIYVTSDYALARMTLESKEDFKRIFREGLMVPKM